MKFIPKNAIVGYGIATVNAMTDSNLLEKMRVSRLPTILVLIEGRTVHYRSSPQYTTAKLVANTVDERLIDH